MYKRKKIPQKHKYSVFINIMDIQVSVGPYASFDHLNKTKDRFLLAMFYEDDKEMDYLIKLKKVRIYYKYPQEISTNSQ